VLSVVVQRLITELSLRRTDPLITHWNIILCFTANYCTRRVKLQSYAPKNAFWQLLDVILHILGFSIKISYVPPKLLTEPNVIW